MKKILIGSVVVIGLIVLVVTFQFNSIIESGVEKVGSQATGTAVGLDSSSVSIFSGSGSLRGLSVANPPGFKAPNAFTLGEVDVAVDTATVLENMVVVKSVRVVEPTVVYELGQKRTNLDALLANVRANSGGSGNGASPDDPGQPAKKIVIDELIVTGGKVEVRMSAMDNAVASVDLPDIRLTNLGRDSGGVDAGQVLRQLLAEVRKATVSAVPNPAKLLQDALGESTQKAGEKIRSTGEAVEDKVKGLFK